MKQGMAKSKCTERPREIVNWVADTG